MDHYFTIEKSSQAEFKDRGSRFIAYVNPVDSVEKFKKLLKELKKEHPKATHHCFAYRIGLEGNFRVNDDGEPAGTAGKQILGQIDSRSVVNIAVIVVRYFGGTLLGVPGLIRAYKTATSLALQLTPIVQKQIEIIYSLEFDHTQMNPVMTVIKKFNCTVLQQQMRLFCSMKIGVPKNRETEVMYSLTELKGVELKVV
jgi:uncharacterized YigZ family protein